MVEQRQHRYLGSLWNYYEQYGESAFAACFSPCYLDSLACSEKPYPYRMKVLGQTASRNSEVKIALMGFGPVHEGFSSFLSYLILVNVEVCEVFEGL